MKIKKNRKFKWIALGILGLSMISSLVIGISSCSSGGGVKYENLINPTEGNGLFLKYGVRENDGNVDSPTDKEIEVTYPKVMKELLASELAASTISETLIKNVVTNWFAGIRYSKNYWEEYDNIVSDTKKSWEDSFNDMKKQHKKSWEYYVQTQLLDQNGGNIENWFYNQIATRVMTSFDSLVSSDIMIGLPEYNGELTYDDLYNPNGLVWKGWTAGNRNNICFTPGISGIEDFDIAVADFQEFIFDQYVREKMPLITSMVLFKHETTTNLSDFFDISEIKQMPGLADSDVVGSAGSYKWQAYPNKNIISQTGEWNATDKYVNFIKEYGDTGDKAVNSNIGGAINIDTRYTDDSATLYKINLDDVFSTSYTPYAAASTYKFNKEVMGVATDSNIATENKLANGLNNIPGTEIMSNFLSTDASAPNGYFALPDTVVSIMDKANSTPGFIAKYDGVKSIADIVDIDGSPFILARNESGVHIIGIDRLDAMVQVKSNYDQLINEIKNTLLWRHMISKNQDVANSTGFSLDLSSEISDYYSNNKAKLIYQYIIAKQEQRNGTSAKWESKGHENYEANRYIFSSEYTNTRWDEGVPQFDPNGNLIPSNDVNEGANDLLINTNVQEYLNAYYAYVDYKKYQTGPTTVTSKLLDAQSSYEGKWYSYSTVENGLAGMMSFTPSYTSKAIVNDQLAFPSILQLVSEDNQKPTSFYQEEKLDQKWTEFKQSANNYFTFLNSNSDENSNNFKLKVVTYPKFEENIFLDSDAEKQKSTDTYFTFMDALNKIINQSLSNGFKTAVEIDKILAEIDDRIYVYDESNPSVNLVGAENKPTTIPSTNDVNFVNYYLSNAMNKILRIGTYTNSNNVLVNGQWIDKDGNANYDTLNEIATKNANTDIKNKYSDQSLTFFKIILTLQYAFDWNAETGQYDFNKFRDYLYDSMSNFQKASFVWKVSDYLEAFDATTPYGKEIEKDFAFKNPIRINNYVNGYAFKDAPKITLSNDGFYDSSIVSLTQDNNIFNVIPIDKDGNNLYAGFKGIQFQYSNSLETEESTSLFVDKLHITDDNGATWKEQGTLFNLGEGTKGKNELEKRIKSIQNWSQIRSSIEWFKSQFDLDVSEANKKLEEGNRNQCIEELVKLIDQIDPNNFNRVQGLQIANSKYVDAQPNNAKYFGTDKTAIGQLVVSQFNKYDVVDLFHDGAGEEITEDDKGINWANASANGFLGTSPDAFFFAAYQWASADQTFASIAYNEMLDIQNNVDSKDESIKALAVQTFSRPLNDVFGKDWASNYKEPVKVK